MFLKEYCRTKFRGTAWRPCVMTSGQFLWIKLVVKYIVIWFLHCPPCRYLVHLFIWLSAQGYVGSIADNICFVCKVIGGWPRPILTCYEVNKILLLQKIIFLSWNWLDKEVGIKSNVFLSRVGKWTSCSKPWSLMSIKITPSEWHNAAPDCWVCLPKEEKLIYYLQFGMCLGV